MNRLRISAISYLNTAPLMWDFEHGNLGKEFEISYTLPSACARALQEGAADIGIIPAAAYTHIADLLVLPGVAIAARRRVRSILLVSNLPVEKIRTVALDDSSLTSVALTKILFQKWWGGPRVYTSAAPDIKKMLAENDAALVIGDPALQIDRSRYLTWDLAEEWNRFTGKSFVFAFWAVRAAALPAHSPRDLATIFQQSRDHGLEPANIKHIKRVWSSRLGLSEADVHSYLTDNIHYQLDTECLDGLNLFYQYGAEIGALPAAPGVKFCEVPNTCIA